MGGALTLLYGIYIAYRKQNKSGAAIEWLRSCQYVPAKTIFSKEAGISCKHSCTILQLYNFHR